MQRELQIISGGVIKRNNANLKQAGKNGKKKNEKYIWQVIFLCDFGHQLNDKKTKKSEIAIQVSSINNPIIPLTMSENL